MTSPRPTPARAPQEAPRWHLRLLGDVVLTDAHGRMHRLPGRTATTLLAHLALAPERAHAREALVELLWPGVALDVGRNRLRQALSTLKQLLDGGSPATPDGAAAVLQAERLTLRLRPGALVCDAWRFERALRAGGLSEAAALYRGELLPGVYDDWVHAERQRLQALADGLPAGLPPPLPAPAPAAPAPAAAPAALNLPHYLTRVYGTEHSASQLLQAVRVQRLVTLLGPGGHGKTRLAVELAHALAAAPLDAAPPDAAQPPPFDLVAFVPLVAARDPDAVLMALLLALRQDSRGADPLDPFDRLASLLDGRRSLLVLDNLEQLVDSCAGLVATLLARCPGLHLLVTSRRVLGLDGEHLHPLPPLPLPPLPFDDPVGDDAGAAAQAMAANPATALFVDRARAARPDFQLDREQAVAVRALVCHLQGMPLAIELAAAQVRSIDPATLLGLLQAEAPQAAPGLALLARSGPRAGADPRHASMLAVVQWSWSLLSPRAQALLPRLSCVAASFTLGAAQALANAPAAEVAQVLDELVSHSMLRSTDGGRRYALFELIREFAASRLDPAAAPGLRQRHRQWLTGWFAALPLSAPLQQVRAEVPNLAAAFLGADLDGADADAAALAAAAQTALSTISLPPQALAALQRCVDRLRDPVARAVGRAGLARSLLVNGQADAAGRLADAALAELPSADGEPAGTGLARAQVLARVAHVRWRLHRDPAAAAWLAEALALARSAGALALQATILTNQGAVLRPHQPQAAIGLQRQAIALWAQAGDRHGVNVGRCNLAMALMARRAGCAEALALLQQAADDTRAADDDLQHALACNLQGEAWSRLGRWGDAAEAYRACIATAWAAAEPWPLAYGLWNLPRALAHLRQPQRAARLMGFAQGHVPTVTGPLARSDRHDLRRVQRLCRCQADAEAVLRWWTEGQAWRLPLAVGEALQR